jgi:hypothetical protein
MKAMANARAAEASLVTRDNNYHLFDPASRFNEESCRPSVLQLIHVVPNSPKSPLARPRTARLQ